MQQEISKKWTHAFDFKGAIKRGGTFDKDANVLQGALKAEISFNAFFRKDIFKVLVK